MKPKTIYISPCLWDMPPSLYFSFSLRMLFCSMRLVLFLQNKSVGFFLMKRTAWGLVVSWLTVSPWLQQQHLHGAPTQAFQLPAPRLPLTLPQGTGFVPVFNWLTAELAPTLTCIKSSLLAPSAQGGKLLGYTSHLSHLSCCPAPFPGPGTSCNPPLEVPSWPTVCTMSQVLSLLQEPLFLIPTEYLCTCVHLSNLRPVSLICPFPLSKFIVTSSCPYKNSVKLASFHRDVICKHWKEKTHE